MTLTLLLSIGVLLIATVHCFTARQSALGVSRLVSAAASRIHSRFRFHPLTLAPSIYSYSQHNLPSLFLHSPHDKYFQLEESEDVDTCTSEVFLNADKTVWLGESDGPLCKSASGRWNLDPDGTFTMSLSRTFDTGKPATTFTDVGEFSFTVNRQLKGEVTLVGEQLSMSGSIYDVDDVFGDRQVGFFSMIDTTDAKLGKDNDTQEETLPTFGRKQTSR